MPTAVKSNLSAIAVWIAALIFGLMIVVLVLNHNTVPQELSYGFIGAIAAGAGLANPNPSIAATPIDPAAIVAEVRALLESAAAAHFDQVGQVIKAIAPAASLPPAAPVPPPAPPAAPAPAPPGPVTMPPAA